PYDKGYSPSDVIALPAAPLSIKDRAFAALEKIRFNKRAKLDKIVQLAAKKGRIRNDDVEKLLRVSDSTAQRYLKQLVQEGRLTARRKGNGAFYEPRCPPPGFKSPDLNPGAATVRWYDGAMPEAIAMPHHEAREKYTNLRVVMEFGGAPFSWIDRI